jgi:hypothetical protein
VPVKRIRAAVVGLGLTVAAELSGAEVLLGHDAPNLGHAVTDAVSQVGPGASERLGRLPGPGHIINGAGDAASAGVKTMRDLENGTATDRVVHKAACAWINGEISETDDYKNIRDKIYRHLFVIYRPGGLLNFIAAPLVNRAAKALAVEKTQGGLSAYYLEHCIRSPPR